MDEHDLGQPVKERKPILRKKVFFIPAAIAAVIALVAKMVLMPIEVSGDSMYPTYSNGSIHFIYKLAYRDRPPARGDIVAVRAADGDLYVKRVLGLPGEVIAIQDGLIYVDGNVLRESFGRGSIPGVLGPTLLGDDEFFVVGDNRRTTVVLPIARDRIIGKVIR